jgi:hypothetical protein
VLLACRTGHTPSSRPQAQEELPKRSAKSCDPIGNRNGPGIRITTQALRRFAEGSPELGA